MLKKLKSAALDVAQSALSTVKITDVPKTSDPLYDNAKLKYKNLSKYLENIIGKLSTIQTHLSEISKISSLIGSNYSKIVKDCSEEYQNHSLTIISFGKQFENLTINFLKPRADAYLLRPLSLLKAELDRLSGIKLQRKEARKNLDSLRGNVALYEKLKRPQVEISKLNEEVSAARMEYERYNQEFITSVQKIDITEEHLKKLIIIFSQYMMQVFIEVQKFRTTFPQEIFDKDYCQNQQNKEPQSIKDLVFTD